MVLIKCPECGTEVSEFAEACPKCAFPMKKMEEIRLNSTEENNKTAEIEDNVENEEVDEEMKFIQSEEKQKLDRITSIILAILVSAILLGLFIYFIVNVKRPNEATNTLKEYTHEDSVAFQKMMQQASIKDSLKIDSLQKIRKETEPYFRKKKDDFSEMTWIIPKSAPVYLNQNGIYLYFGIDAREHPTSLRIRIQYAASDWLFFNIIRFAIDGETFSLTPYEVNREVVDGGIVEWIDEPTYTESIMLNNLRKAKTAKMRFEGEHFSSDKVITQQQIKDIDRVLSLYEAYGGRN